MLRMLLLLCCLVSSAQAVTVDEFMNNFPEGIVRTHAREIAEDVIASLRVIKGASRRYGYRYPGNLDHLHTLLQEGVQGKRVLEIAGADGSNALLFALAGATVYMNDIAEPEIAAFSARVAQLPENIRQNIHALPGDIFRFCLKKRKKVKPLTSSSPAISFTF